MFKHFLQSKEWQKYEELEGHQTFTEEQDDFAYLAVKHATKLGTYLNVPYGPSLKTSNQESPTNQNDPETDKLSITTTKKSLQKALESLRSLAKEQNCFFIRLEPTAPLDAEIMRQNACVKSTNIDPAHTWLLRLDDKSENDLLKGMESRKVRYWRNATKKGISLRQTQNPEEITILTTFLKTLGEKDNFNPQTTSHLKNQLKTGFATLYVAELETPETGAKTPIAAALIYDSADTRFYMHAATDFEHRNLMAGTIILIQMILDAKAQSKKYYDFWGITTSEDKNHPWYGFTQYKKSFGGFERDYAGTYDLPLNKTKYSLYKKLRTMNRKLRKL
ncbi:peptidoglycan bridge formation glycyltransferase FemA/FemB family protein [Candidatus Saccharibacteria bacterium]|nr:peptidoglycan bridge formation glycyltransferase FemA/FemB family protein [Candidatus Saccharibacteria bacterium]